MNLIAYLRITTHILRAMLIVVFCFPFVTFQHRQTLIQKWSLGLLKILGVELNVQQRSSLPTQGCLFVANHISWLDIHVINAFLPVRFVAKSEVASWPIFGWLADKLNTIYVKRDSNGEAKKVVNLIKEALSNQEKVCVFPEGTSTDGISLLEFKSNLFQASIDAQTPCVALSIDYRDKPTNERTTAPAFIGDMGLIESIMNVIKAPKMVVHIDLKLVEGGGEDRKTLAREAFNTVVLMRNR